MAGKPPPPVPDPGSFGARLFNVFSRLHVLAHRLTRGRIGGEMQGAPVCILHTVGRRSGKPRETPLFYLADGADVILVGSRGGSEAMPAWYLNLMAMDSAVVEVKGLRTTYRPRRASAGEKAAYWPKLNAMYAHYEDYQQRTSRDIPVIVMSPTT
jgi:deazaflavin-dependent oxidoreductase (nitroreductase family)